MEERYRLLQRMTLVATVICTALALACASLAQAQTKRPNIVVFWGDDIGQSNIVARDLAGMGAPPGRRMRWTAHFGNTRRIEQESVTQCGYAEQIWMLF